MTKTLELPKTFSRRTEELSDYVFGKLPPQALALEEAVLGAIMLDRDAMSVVQDIVKTESFYSAAHQSIFRAFVWLYERTQPIDLLTVMERLKKSGELDMIGGPAYIASLTNKVASAANIEFHARIIEQKFIQRELIRISSEVTRMCFDETCDVFETMDLLDESFAKLSNQLNSSTRKLHSIIQNVLSVSLEKHESNGALIGFPITGNYSIDRPMNGAEPGDFIIVSGYSGHGKSSLCNNFAFTCDLFNEPYYDWSGELSSEARVTRLLSLKSGVNNLKIRSGAIYKNEPAIKAVRQAADDLVDKNIFFDDSVMDMRRFVSVITTHNRKHGVKIFVFDRIELFDPAHTKGDKEKAKEDFCIKARSLAKQLNIIIIILCQLRKPLNGITRKPTAFDLRGTGELYNSPTKILATWLPEKAGITEDAEGYSTHGRGEILILKNTNGESGKEIPCRFYETRTGWHNDYIKEDIAETVNYEKVEVNNLTDHRPDIDEDLPF